MLAAVFIIELILLSILIYKYGIINPITFGFIIFFLYAQAFYIDNILFDIQYITLSGFDKLYITDSKYLYLTFMYFIFFIGYSLVPIFYSNKMENVSCIYHPNNSFKYQVLIYICIVSIIAFLYTTYDFSRYEKIDWFQSHKFITILINIIGYVWVINFLRMEFTLKSKYLIMIFTSVFIIFAFFEGGRELIVYIILCILFLKFDRYNYILVIFAGTIIFLFILILKPILIHIVSQGFNIQGFITSFLNNPLFLLTNNDPKASIFLLTAYFDEKYQFFYDRFNFTYIENTFSQFLRALKIIEYKSLAEQVAAHFMGTNIKGRGYAFSGILESILNFWYFGPFLLGLFLGYLTKKINDIKYFDKYKYKVLSLFIIIIMFKLVRTELAVVLKIYVLPMLIAYFIAFRNSYSYKDT